MPPRFKKISLDEFQHAQHQKPTKPLVELSAKHLQTKVWITNETTCSPTMAVSVAAPPCLRDIIKNETQQAVADQLKREEEALMEKQQQEKPQREYLQQQELQQQEQKLEMDNYALIDIDTNNTVDHDTEHQDFTEDQVEITCEEAKKDPVMNPNEFAKKFKYLIQQILFQIRKLHSKQAQVYQKNSQYLEKAENENSAIREAFARRLFEEYGLLAKMNGFDREPMQRIMNFILVHRVCTSYYRKQRYHSTPLKEQRFCASSFTYRGPNYSSDRFQIDSIECELFKAFGWCDMKHVHTIASGDILFAQTDEYYYWDEGSYETASSLCMILLPKTAYDYITPLFVCKLDEANNRSTTNPTSFFHAMNRNLKHVCSSDIPKAVHSRRKITDENLQNRQTSFVAAFDQIQIWVNQVYNLKAEQTLEDASSSCSPLLPIHCELLYGLGSEQHTFLNLLLNAMLPREVLCYILRLKFDNNSFPNFPRNRLTPEQFMKITDECPGIANVFSVIHAFEQRAKFEQTSADEFKDLFMLRMAMDIENYVTDCYCIYTLPTDISGHLTGISKIPPDVRRQYKNQELLRIINHACKYGGDLGHLTSFHDFASWRASENSESDKL